MKRFKHECKFPPCLTTRDNTESLSAPTYCSMADPDLWPPRKQTRGEFMYCYREWKIIMWNWPCVVCGKQANPPPPLVSPRISVSSPPQWGVPWKNGQGHRTSQPNKNKDKELDKSPQHQRLRLRQGLAVFCKLNYKFNHLSYKETCEFASQMPPA